MTPAQNTIIGWLIPIIIVMFNICFEYENYGGEYHCWLQLDTGLMYGQFLPIGLMTIITLAIIEAAGTASYYEKLEKVDEEQRKTAKIMQRTLVLILPTVIFYFYFFRILKNWKCIYFSGFCIISCWYPGWIWPKYDSVYYFHNHQQCFGRNDILFPLFSQWKNETETYVCQK